jgi:hypothetical protein
MNGAAVPSAPVGTPKKRYRVVARCASRVRIARGKGFEVNGADGSVVRGATTYDIDRFGSAVPGWLQVEVECSAEDPAGAEHLTLQYAHQVACLLALAGNAPIGLPQVFLLYEIRDDEAPRVWEQQVHEDEPRRSSRLVDESHLKALYAGLDSVGAEAAAKISRALRWYRSALATDDLLERFTMVWAGLECLNRLLIDHLGLPINEESPCPHCGQPIQRPSANGVHGWIESAQGSDVRRKARKLRTQLQHGTGDIGEAAVAVDEVGAKVERALVLAILELLKVNLVPPPEALAPQVIFLAKVTGALKGPVEKALRGSPGHPHISGALVVKGSKNSGPDHGSVEFEYALPGDKVVPEGVTIDVNEIQAINEPLD